MPRIKSEKEHAMKISHEDDKFEIDCNRDELMILNNALNNIPQAVGANEYTTLIGATRDEVEAVLNKIGKALRRGEHDKL